MNKKALTGIIAGAVLLLSSAVTPVCAGAATIEEALDYARSLGWPEDMIQQAANAYYENPELFPPDELDRQMEQLTRFQQDIVTNVPHDPDASPSTSTEPVQTDPEAPQPSDGSFTLTMPDGSTFTRISREAFINMSYEEKMAYLSTFTPEQQTVFINDLSPEEYRSLMKQLPADKKTDIINDMAEYSRSLGLNLSVEEISDDNIIVSMKNDNGELLAVNSARDTIENTGYDRRGIFALSAFLVTAGAAGLFALIRKVFREESK